MNYYNEFDSKAAQWLRELIKQGSIPNGLVDERSIADVRADELREFTQCHFFAGIGGWSYALQLAGWPDDKPVWTGSCPCQPFSSAGKRKGTADERHLWPVFFNLIKEFRPDTVFGEQVAAAIGQGWLDGISADLEGEGYACGAVVLGAHSVGAPHIRQRLYWVAESQSKRLQITGNQPGYSLESSSIAEWLANSINEELEGYSGNGNGSIEPGREPQEQAGSAATGCDPGRIPDTEHDGLHGTNGDREATEPQVQDGADRLRESEGRSCLSFWDSYRVAECRDGKFRRIPIEPIFQFKFDGVSSIMGSSWDYILAKLKKEVIRYANAEEKRPREILREMWEITDPDSIWQDIGGHDQVFKAKVLFFALCQLHWSEQSEFNISAQDFAKVKERTMRTLWRKGTVACSSLKQGLEGSSTRESSDFMHSLPPAQSTQATTENLLLLRTSSKTQRDVPETLAEIQEIWRSILNQEDDKSMGRIRDGFRIIEAMDGFPLSLPIPARVAILKGIGNAIVPQVAAEFIKAYTGN